MSTNWQEKARLWADFNEMFRGNLLEVDLNFAMPQGDTDLSPGDWVRIYDGEGNECSGLIDNIEGPRLLIKLDLGSWSSVAIEILSQPLAPASIAPNFDGSPTRPVRVGG